MPVWDLPTRLFHWLLVINFAACWITFELGEMTWHFYAGYSLLGLLVFRLLWGFIGSQHARFTDFLPRPRSIADYLRTGHSPTPGHNPLGAPSVFALLGLLIAQVTTGLFNADDSGNKGPYHMTLPTGWADRIGSWHSTLFDGLLVLLVLHLGAVLFYQFIKHKALIQAMWHGFKPGESGAAPPVSHWWALLALSIGAGLVGALLLFAPEPEYTAYF